VNFSLKHSQGKTTSPMTEFQRLLAARQQVENIFELTKDNEWREYMARHLVLLHVELERQIENCIARGEDTLLTDKDEPPTMPE